MISIKWFYHYGKPHLADPLAEFTFTGNQDPMRNRDVGVREQDFCFFFVARYFHAQPAGTVRYCGAHFFLINAVTQEKQGAFIKLPVRDLSFFELTEKVS